MRLFFGIFISNDVRERVESAQRQLRSAGEKVKWVEPTNLHITLRFIGDVPDAEAERVGQAAEGSWDGVPVTPCVFRGVGAFPNPRRPRVVWVGLSEGRETLTGLHANLSGRLQERLGLPTESREFVPHLTIGRVKAPPRSDALAKLIGGLGAEEFGSFFPDRFALCESTLTPRGPIYRVLRSYAAPNSVQTARAGPEGGE